MKKVAIITIILGLLATGQASNVPESKQATIIDATSSAEVLLRATGIFESDKRGTRRKRKDVKKKGLEEAKLDARRAALYYLLLSGTDPILGQQAERDAFANIQEAFFEKNMVLSFITYEDAVPIENVYLSRKTGLRVVLELKLNREAIVAKLEQFGIVMTKDTVLELVGNPYIMVLPAVGPDENPIEWLQTKKPIKHGAGVIQSLLTARQYDVIVPDQQQFLNELNTNQFSVANNDDDIAYQLALSVGSDIYIDFDIATAKGGYGTTQRSVTVRAFETTTGRLLGSETGYSQARQGQDFVSIEEAMLEAINNVLTRVSKYWKRDIANGIQYKVVTRINVDQEDLEETQDDLIDALDAVSTKTKEVIVSDKTVDYVIWVDPQKYTTSRRVWRAIRRQFRVQNESAALKQVNQNRKMLLLEMGN